MRKCLSELSLRGRRVLFLSKLALSPRQCGKHRRNSLIVRAYQLVVWTVSWRSSRRLALQYTRNGINFSWCMLVLVVGFGQVALAATGNARGADDPKVQPELYFVKVSVDKTLLQISLNAEPDGLEIVSTSVSLSGT
jgi:hypothetical protein